MKTLARYTGISFLLLLILSGCERAPDSWTPVLEHTSTTFLETETERALQSILSASAELGADQEEAAEELRNAAATLQNLKDFYLPLFRARERSYNAYRYYRLGLNDQADGELEAVEQTLSSMVAASGGGPLRELQVLAESVADARIALQGTPEEAEAALEALAERLDDVVLKGDLITESS